MSLFAMCLDVVTKPNVIETYKKDLSVIPATIKTAILTFSCKRGHLDLFMFQQLVNSNITSLDLSECEVTDEFLCCLHKCIHLQKLNLTLGRRQNRYITSKSLKTLFEHLNHLKTVIIPQCPEINDEVMEVICKNCLDLRELHIPYSLITDYSLHLMGQHIKSLSVLNVCGTQITDLGILHLANGFLSLSLAEINIDKCTNITVQSSIVIAEKFPNIKIFNCGFLGNNELFNLVMNKININAKQIFWTLE